MKIITLIAIMLLIAIAFEKIVWELKKRRKRKKLSILKNRYWEARKYDR